MKLKKLIAIVLACLMLMCCMAGCGGSDEEESLDFYFISLMTGGAAWSRAEKGFNDACEDLGINGQYLAPVERNSMTEMATLLDQAVTQQGDAIIGVYASAEMFGPSLTKARENGIVTASVQIDLSEEYVDFNIGTNQTNIGVAMGEAVVELAAGGEYTVMFLTGSASELSNMQFTAFEEVLAEHDNITSLGMYFDEGSASTANQVITDTLTACPELNAVVCLDSSAATIGCASFVDEKGLEDEWLTIGIDSSADILNYVKSGALDATLNQDFYAMGYNSVKMAYELIVNGTQPEFTNDTGCTLILPDEVEAYAAENDIDLG